MIICEAYNLLIIRVWISVIMQLLINVKVNSLRESNKSVTFESNQHGLFNVSELHRIFNEAKHRLDLADPNSYINQFPDMYDANSKTSHQLASEVMLQSLADGDDFLLQDGKGDYWCNASIFKFLLKGASPLYADGINAIESGNCVSYKDYAIQDAKIYTVLRTMDETTEGYKAYAIHTLSKLFRDLEQLVDFIASLSVHFDQLCEKNNFTGEQYDNVIKACWHTVMFKVNDFIGELNKFDPELRDVDSFWLRYRSMLRSLREEIDARYDPWTASANVPAAPAAPAGSKIGNFFKKFK